MNEVGLCSTLHFYYLFLEQLIARLYVLSDVICSHCGTRAETSKERRNFIKHHGTEIKKRDREKEKRVFVLVIIVRILIVICVDS